MYPTREDDHDNVTVPEVVGKTIGHMRVYLEAEDCHEVSLWFTDGTQLTVEIESRTQINLKHLSRPEEDPDRITERMNILHSRSGE